jgi:hypothetical protein
MRRPLWLVVCSMMKRHVTCCASWVLEGDHQSRLCTQLVCKLCVLRKFASPLCSTVRAQDLHVPYIRRGLVPPCHCDTGLKISGVTVWRWSVQDPSGTALHSEQRSAAQYQDSSGHCGCVHICALFHAGCMPTWTYNSMRYLGQTLQGFQSYLEVVTGILIPRSSLLYRLLPAQTDLTEQASSCSPSKDRQAWNGTRSKSQPHQSAGGPASSAGFWQCSRS